MSSDTSAGGGQAKRTILNRVDISGTDKVAMIGVGDAVAGASIGPHSHPGEEQAYVVSGQVVLKVAGKPDRVLQEGDTYALARGEIHDIVSKNGPSRVVVVWIVDKSQAFSAPAP